MQHITNPAASGEPSKISSSVAGDPPSRWRFNAPNENGRNSQTRIWRRKRHVPATAGFETRAPYRKPLLHCTMKLCRTAPRHASPLPWFNAKSKRHLVPAFETGRDAGTAACEQRMAVFISIEGILEL